jgi:iron complex transport system substrate-binding protein
LIRVRIIALAAALAAGCSSPQLTPPEPIPPALPQRVVSLDYCADQFVLKLADRDQIAAVSIDADREFSYMREAANGLRQVRTNAEDVLALRPDLVVRAYGGGPNAPGLLARAGVATAQLGYAEDFSGVRKSIRQIAAALGHSARGEAVIAEMDARLAAVAAQPRDQRAAALYVTPSGYTSGAGSLVDVMITAAGLSNFEQQPGWRPVNLERLAREQPDIVAAAFFDLNAIQQDSWSSVRHPVMAQAFAKQPTVALPGAWTACGGWFLVEAVERLAVAPVAP